MIYWTVSYKVWKLELEFNEWTRLSSSRTSLYIIKNYVTNDNMLLRKIWKISVDYKNSYYKNKENKEKIRI